MWIQRSPVAFQLKGQVMRSFVQQNTTKCEECIIIGRRCISWKYQHLIMEYYINSFVLNINYLFSINYVLNWYEIT